MQLNWEQVVIDARDPIALGHWWANALGWVVVNDDVEEFEIRPEPDRVPGLLFELVPDRFGRDGLTAELAERQRAIAEFEQRFGTATRQPAG